MKINLEHYVWNRWNHNLYIDARPAPITREPNDVFNFATKVMTDIRKGWSQLTYLRTSNKDFRRVESYIRTISAKIEWKIPGNV